MPKNPETKRICAKCGAVFMGYGRTLCKDCDRARKAARMAARREQKRIELMSSNDVLEESGWKICAKCHHKRMISEFGTSQSNRMGKLNKICDRCLTRMYLSPARKSEGFDEAYWRRRAYTANSVARQRYAREFNVKLSEVSLTDLDWVCKPQELAKLYDEQNGKCIYCGVDLKPDATQLDHVVPLSRGGKHDPSNIALACRDCNSLKGPRTADEFNEFVRQYSKRILEKIAEEADKEPPR